MGARHRLVAVAATAVLAGCGATGSGGSEDIVGDYCAYGAVSRAQLDGCVDHVTDEDVDGYDTNAAQYARGELDKCLKDSGPFCHDR
jgi:hypothetical protein